MESDRPAPPTAADTPPVRMRSIHAAVQMMDARQPAPADPLARKRRLVADLCRILGDQLNRNGGPPGPAVAGGGPPPVALSPRMRQTLERLLAGDSEKEIAARLKLSPHTVHVYIKTLYRRFDVCSRGELFARFIQRGGARVHAPPSPE